MRNSKSINIHIYMGGSYNVKIVPLKREKIYGERVIVPLDKENRECKRAMVSENGEGIYPNGSISICKVMTDGTASYKPKRKGESVLLEEDDFLETVRGDENILYEFGVTSSFNFLNTVESIYTIEGGDKYELINEIKGKFFKMNFRKTQRGPLKKTIIFENHGKVFMEVCKPVEFQIEFAKKTELFSVDDEPLISELDDVDFTLF